MFIQTNQRGKKDSNKILNESGDITNATEKKIARYHYKQLYTNKLDNPYEMDKFLDTKLTTLNHEEV